MRRAAPPSPVKASESVVSRMLAKMLGFTACDTLQELQDSLPQPNSTYLASLVDSIHGLYPWVADVAADIMNSSSTPLAEHLMSLPGQPHVVKDKVAAGPESLWIAVADPPARIMDVIQHKMCCRGLFHTFKVGDDLSMVVAIQLSSCQP